MSARSFLAVEPRIQIRDAEAPLLSNMASVNLATPRKLLQCFVMNLE
jgi:hypothetical protein